jgi:hypothetical protein
MIECVVCQEALDTRGPPDLVSPCANRAIRCFHSEDERIYGKPYFIDQDGVRVYLRDLEPHLYQASDDTIFIGEYEGIEFRIDGEFTLHGKREHA